MVQSIEITDENLVEAINDIKLLPDELHKVRRRAQLDAGKAARSLSKKTFRQRTGIRSGSLAKRRTKGSGPRAWLGGSAVPVKHIAGLVNVRRGKRTRVNSRTQTRKKRGQGQVSEAVQYVGDKIFINNEYIPEAFALNVPGRPIYHRVRPGRGGLEAIKQNIGEETFQAAEDVIPEVRKILQESFLRRANEQLSILSGKSFSARKSKVEDRLSGIKFIRTNVR